MNGTLHSCLQRSEETEQGIRKSLNFGHTIGHAIESLSMGALFHGEAIMHGMAIELRLSELELGLDKRVRLTIEDTIKANYPSLPDIELEDVLSLIQNDKKNTAGRTSFTLLESPGHPQIDVEVPEDRLRSVLKDYGLQ